MRKGNALLWQTVFSLIASFCLLLPGMAQAAALESTDSGAPSALLIFPASAKPEVAGMPPVAYNHLVHEKWAAKNKKDCIVCHHTGDLVSCVSCHTVEGTKEGNYVTLYAAMHSPNVESSKENPPASCVSCHSRQIKQRECAGCHESLVSKNVRKQTSWCAVCHKAPGLSKAQYESGVKGTLPESENEKLAEKIAAGRDQNELWPPMAGPYKVKIDTLANEYEPSIFNHKHHVAVLMERIGDNKLAGAFHHQPATLCQTCHHRSPATKTPPQCVSCHSEKINPENPGKPSLKAAFHLQCVSCHSDMKVARPRPTDCAGCHKSRQAQLAEKGGEKK